MENDVIRQLDEEIFDSKPVWQAEVQTNHRVAFGVFLGFTPFTVSIYFWRWIVGFGRFRRLKPSMGTYTNVPSQ